MDLDEELHELHRKNTRIRQNGVNDLQRATRKRDEAEILMERAGRQIQEAELALHNLPLIQGVLASCKKVRMELGEGAVLGWVDRTNSTIHGTFIPVFPVPTPDEDEDDEL